MFTWIHGASVSLQQFLAGRLADGPPTLADRFGAGGTARVSLYTPQEMAEIPEEGLSLWLYRIVRDEFQLNRPPTRILVGCQHPRRRDAGRGCREAPSRAVF